MILVMLLKIGIISEAMAQSSQNGPVCDVVAWLMDRNGRYLSFAEASITGDVAIMPMVKRCVKWVYCGEC